MCTGEQTPLSLRQLKARKQGRYAIGTECDARLQMEWDREGREEIEQKIGE